LDEPAAKRAPPVPALVKDLPAGLRFSVNLETNLDTRESWVGDPIEGRLGEPLRSSSEVLAPRGARIVGRLVALESHVRPDEGLEVGLDWQQIEVTPNTVLRLRADYSNISMDVTASSNGGGLSSGRGRSRGPVGHGFESQPIGVGERPNAFLLGGSHKSVPKHLQTWWITVPVSKDPAKATIAPPGLAPEPSKPAAPPD
jgi:hypothetical protein